MSNIIDLRCPAPPITDAEIDKLHAEAFRDLEGQISDCLIMAMIALQVAEHALDKDEKAMFAVCHVAQMLKKLTAGYQAAYHCERAPARPID